MLKARISQYGPEGRIERVDSFQFSVGRVTEGGAMIVCKYGTIGPGEVMLSAKACEGLDNVALAGVTRWMLELSKDAVHLDAHMGGREPFSSIEQFMAYKSQVEGVKTEVT